jgi:hypothetical protein
MVEDVVDLQVENQPAPTEEEDLPGFAEEEEDLPGFAEEEEDLPGFAKESIKTHGGTRRHLVCLVRCVSWSC